MPTFVNKGKDIFIQCPPSPPPSSSPVKARPTNTLQLLNNSKNHNTKRPAKVRKDKKKVSFWTLKTLVSEDFDLSRLTERQQVSFFAAQSQSANNPLLASPFRIDRMLAENTPKSSKGLKVPGSSLKPTNGHISENDQIELDLVKDEDDNIENLPIPLPMPEFEVPSVEGSGNTCARKSEDNLFQRLQMYFSQVQDIYSLKSKIACEEKERRTSQIMYENGTTEYQRARKNLRPNTPKKPVAKSVTQINQQRPSKMKRAEDNLQFKENNIKAVYIPTPRFRKAHVPKIEGLKKRDILKAEAEIIDDCSVYKRHKPLEVAEKRARKREHELDKYVAYIEKLKQDSPELWSRRTGF